MDIASKDCRVGKNEIEKIRRNVLGKIVQVLMNCGFYFKSNEESLDGLKQASIHHEIELSCSS